MTTFIRSIGIANPGHKIPQEKIENFMANAFNFKNGEKVKHKILYRASGIRYRHSVIKDYEEPVEDYTFFPGNDTLEPFPDTEQRMKKYKKEAIELSLNAIDKCLQADEETPSNELSHLITVSCTGFYAPGIDIELVDHLNLNPSIERTSINFMGCYAAFNAIKMANYICQANKEAKVLIICIELCSLHFQKEPTEDNILANALFGDGAAAVIMSSKPSKNINLQIQNTYNTLALQGKNDMAWHIGNFGFQMHLSSYVPDIIKQGIKGLSHKLIDHLNLNLSQIDYFAIHPGGKRILELIENELQLPKEKNHYAYEVLKEFGNMSSPTVLFVLYKIILDLKEADKHKNILSFAFGPGLTLEGILYKIC